MNSFSARHTITISDQFISSRKTSSFKNASQIRPLQMKPESFISCDLVIPSLQAKLKNKSQSKQLPSYNKHVHHSLNTISPNKPKSYHTLLHENSVLQKEIEFLRNEILRLKEENKSHTKFNHNNHLYTSCHSSSGDFESIQIKFNCNANSNNNKIKSIALFNPKNMYVLSNSYKKRIMFGDIYTHKNSLSTITNHSNANINNTAGNNSNNTITHDRAPKLRSQYNSIYIKCSNLKARTKSLLEKYNHILTQS